MSLCIILCNHRLYHKTDVCMEMFSFETKIKAGVAVEGRFGPRGPNPKAVSWRASCLVRSITTGVVMKVVDAKK